MDHDDRLNNNKAVQSTLKTTSPASFWRPSSRKVPGRASYTTTTAPTMAHNNKQVGSSFQTYQDSVSDAWDLGDDEFCIISGLSDTKISRRVSQSAAMNVIRTHRQSNHLVNQQQNNRSDRQTVVTGVHSNIRATDQPQGPLVNNNNINNNHCEASAAATSSDKDSDCVSSGTTPPTESDTANENCSSETK